MKFKIKKIGVLILIILSGCTYSGVGAKLDSNDLILIEKIQKLSTGLEGVRQAEAWVNIFIQANLSKNHKAYSRLLKIAKEKIYNIENHEDDQFILSENLLKAVFEKKDLGTAIEIGVFQENIINNADPDAEWCRGFYDVVACSPPSAFKRNLASTFYKLKNYQKAKKYASSFEIVKPTKLFMEYSNFNNKTEILYLSGKHDELRKKFETETVKPEWSLSGKVNAWILQIKTKHLLGWNNEIEKTEILKTLENKNENIPSQFYFNLSRNLMEFDFEFAKKLFDDALEIEMTHRNEREPTLFYYLNLCEIFQSDKCKKFLIEEAEKRYLSEKYFRASQYVQVLALAGKLEKAYSILLKEPKGSTYPNLRKKMIPLGQLLEQPLKRKGNKAL